VASGCLRDALQNFADALIIVVSDFEDGCAAFSQPFER